MLDLSKEEREGDHLLYAYENIERIRNDFYQFVEREKFYGRLPSDFKLPPDQWTATIEDNIIKINIPDYPVRTSYVSKLFKNRWVKNMVDVINNLEKKPFYEKVMVLMHFYIPTKDWDVDNREYKPIIDGIRYSRIIKSDDYEHLAFGAEGDYSENPHTEVTIIDYNVYKKIINE